MDEEKSKRFYNASFYGNLAAVKALSQDPAVNLNWQAVKGFTPFFAACQEGMIETVEFLLGLEGLDPNLPNENGATPFYLACQQGHVAAVSLLLTNQKIAVNKPKVTGATPFFIACEEGRVEVVKLLLADERIDLNKAQKEGANPFSIACQYGHVDVVSLLLADERIDLNKAMSNESTPLWYASQNAHLAVVSLILASGRKINTEKKSNFNHKTAAEQARFLVSRAEKDKSEFEEDFQRRKSECLPIADLIALFERVPLTTQSKLRKDLNIRDQWIEEYLGIQVSFCAKVTPPESKDPQEIESLSLADCSLSSIPSKIENFTNLTAMDLSHNIFGDSSAKVISNLLKSKKKLKSLRLIATRIGPKGMLQILQAMVWNFSQGNFSLESVGVDDKTLESFDGLRIIPIDILRMGILRIVRFLLDLYQSPEADPLFRSKLMVVGFAEMGKTSLLECLFPLAGILLTKDVKKRIFMKDLKMWNDCFLHLIGNKLTQSDLPRFHNHVSDPKKTLQHFGTIYLGSEKNGWSIERVDGDEQPGFRIVGQKEGFVGELYCTNRIEREKWFVRIDELLKRTRTHGIDIREIDISSHPVVKKHFGANSWKGKVELSVWDFAGQHEYYNSHQHFLSTRSVFLVLWNVTEFDEKVDVVASVDQGQHRHQGGSKPQQGKGIQGLEFWLWSLSFHLNQLKKDGGNDCDPRDYFKIIVIGTHFDQLDEKDQNKMGIRKSVVEKLCMKYGLRLGLRNYLEVSCVDDLVNIEILQDMVFEETVRMKYMGERVPLTYLSVESYLGHLLELHREYPIVDIRLFFEQFPDERLVRDALSLLHEWGKCVYFGNDERLKDQVVLDPQFLSKTTLAGFFRLGEEAGEKKKNGVIHHSDLRTFWAEPSSTSSLSPPSKALVDREDFWQVAELLMKFMEKFDVCFVLPKDRGIPFVEQHSVLPSLLPSRKNFGVIKKELLLLNGQMGIIRSKIKELSPEYEINKKLVDKGLFNENGIIEFRKLEKELTEEIGRLKDLEKTEKELGNELKAAHPWNEYWGADLGRGQVVQFERVFQFGSIPAELISRMLARLHGMIEGGCVMRDCALLRNNSVDDGITQAKVTVDLLLDQFVIEIRSGSLELGDSMLTEIRESISKVLDLYPQLTVPVHPSVDPDQEEERTVVIESQIVEGVRSPFSGRIIPLEMIKEAKGKDLVLGGDEPEISVLKLKEMAGLIAPKPLVKKQIYQGSSEWNELVKMFKGLGGEEGQIKQAFDLEDPEYRSMFEGNRKLFYQQHRNAPEIFQKQDHKHLSNPGLREQYLGLLRRKQQKYELSLPSGDDSDHKTGVLAMIHGTNESIGWKIAQGGFGIVSSIDAGYYGQGIYFTSKVEYAQYYAGTEKPVLVISMVNPGNVFPVIEHPSQPGSLMGEKCKLGYQSHYCVTGKGFYPTDKVEEDSRDDLVVFERAQALPKFMIYFN